MPGTRKLGRDTAHRLAMLRGLVTFFFENGKIETTATRAQEVRALAEKMITIAKEDTLANRRNVMAFITTESVTNKLFKEIAPKYADSLFAFCGERKFFLTSQKEKKGKFSVIKCENSDILCIFCGFPCILGHYPL